MQMSLPMYHKHITVCFWVTLSLQILSIKIRILKLAVGYNVGRRRESQVITTSSSAFGFGARNTIRYLKRKSPVGLM